MAQGTQPKKHEPPGRRLSEVHMASYYHPGLKNMNQVQQIFKPYLGKDGSFLVRNSFSKRDFFTISVMHNNSIKHFNIGSSGYRMDASISFDKIDDLVTYYSMHDVPNIENVACVRLKFPIRQLRASQMPPELPTGPVPNLDQEYIDMRKTPRRSSIVDRPPMPLPIVQEQNNSAVYSTVRELIENKTDTLIEQLKGIEDKCECGLFVTESVLPNNWTMHLSQENQTKGKIFFMDGEGNSFWHLPTDIVAQLSQYQHDNIKRVTTLQKSLEGKSNAECEYMEADGVNRHT